MKNLDTTESLKWIQQNEIVQVEPNKLRFAADSEKHVRIKYPSKPSEIIPVSLMITGVGTELESNYEGSLFWITDFGIWGDEQEQIARLLLAKIRGTGVDEAILAKWPATAFDERELDLQRAAIVIPLSIGWDAYYVPRHKHHFVFVSHDEFIDVTCRTDEAFAHWTQIEARWR
jgi:hypothetical protein